MPTAWKTPAKTNVPKIAICIPYNGNWLPEWTDKVYMPLRYMPTNWCTKVTFLSKVQSLPVARDILVQEAIKSNCDYILFVDTDIICETPSDPNVTLKQLYDCINKDKNTKDGKIVGSLYRAKQKQGFSYAMWMQVNDPNIKGYTPISDWTGNWLEVSATGLGFALIDIDVFKNIERPFFRWELKDDNSEDFYFFRLAKKYGYNTHIFTETQLSHLGTLKVKSDGTIVTPDM